MGNKRSRRSRRLATPSPEREVSETRVDSSETGNITLTNSNLNVQENLSEPNLENQLREPSQISDEIQVWTQIVERKNTERIEKMREEMDSKLEAILKEIKCNKSASITTNPRSEANEIQEPRPSGSRLDPSIGVRASNNGNSDSENDDYPLRASKMKDLKHPAKPLFRSESDVDMTIHSDEESNAESLDEDYHMVTGVGTSERPLRDITEYEEKDLSARPAKRPRPRYCLTETMFRKHPVLKFFATGPIDREKTPYKWWCRVCRVELSLMSRGPLELLSHYRTESHLLKEHRIRMETPGLPLYDREEVELQGIALQEAKRSAKDMHPIAPQRDLCRLLVGQEKLPELRSDSAPIDVVLSQIRVLELGLKHGGNVASLVAIHDEILQHSAGGSAIQTLDWSDSRIFVSIYCIYYRIIPLTAWHDLMR